MCSEYRPDITPLPVYEFHRSTICGVRNKPANSLELSLIRGPLKKCGIPVLSPKESCLATETATMETSLFGALNSKP